MKLTSVDKAVLFLAAGLAVLLYLSVKAGQARTAGWWTIGLCGCGIMLYASHGGAKRVKETVVFFAELFSRRKQ